MFLKGLLNLLGAELCWVQNAILFMNFWNLLYSEFTLKKKRETV